MRFTSVTIYNCKVNFIFYVTYTSVTIYNCKVNLIYVTYTAVTIYNCKVNLIFNITYTSVTIYNCKVNLIFYVTYTSVTIYNCNVYQNGQISTSPTSNSDNFIFMHHRSTCTSISSVRFSLYKLNMYICSLYNSSTMYLINSLLYTTISCFITTGH